MDRREHWQTVYGNMDENKVSWFQERPVASLELLRRIGLNSDDLIIDVGAGASRLVDCLLDLGQAHVAVLDIAETALTKSRARLAARASLVEWIVADVTDWRPARKYDVWHDRAVFHFLTEASDRKAYATAMAAAVRLGGHAIIATFGPDGPEMCSGLPTRRYDGESLVKEFAPDFGLVDGLAEDHVTPGGKIQKFQISRLRRLR